MGVRAIYLSKRSQTSIEYLIILVVMMLILTLVFIYTNVNYTASTNIEQGSDAVRTIAAAADKLYAMQPGTKTFVYVTFPESITSTNITAHEISIKFKTSSGETETFAVTTARVTGSLPVEGGMHVIQLEVLSTGVVNIGFITGPGLEDLTPPAVTFIPPTPDNGANLIIGAHRIKVSAVDANSTIISCLLHFDSSIITMTIEGSGKSVNCYSDVSLFTGGSHSYYVTAVDAALNEGRSETRTLTILRRGVKEALLAYYISGMKDTPQYKLWDKIKWGNENAGADTGANLDLVWYTLVSNPQEDEKILLLRSDVAPPAASPAYAEVWNGAGWGGVQQITADNGEPISYGALDAAYESLSGIPTVVYFDEATFSIKYRTWNGLAWSNPSAVPINIAGQVSFIRLASNPLSNEITVVILTTDGRLQSIVWKAGSPNAPEVCDGIDNNLNGLVDDDVAPLTCPRQTGVCAGAKRYCVNSALTECSYGNGITYEIIETRCDSLDNDCDGTVDEDCLNLTQDVCTGQQPNACGNYFEPVLCGLMGCTWIQPPRCVPPGPHTCDYYNDSGLCSVAGCTWMDCEEDRDNDGFGPANKIINACPHPFQIDCLDDYNYSIPHTEDTHPNATEICDNRDNDCNNVVDNMTVQCPLLFGVCGGVKHTCTLGSWSNCDYGADYEADETSCDGMDNDCDGFIDESCAWSNNITITTKAEFTSPATRAFDVAYEQKSGKALVTWQDNGTVYVRYRIWNGSKWGSVGETPYSLFSVNQQWYKLAPRRDSNSIFLGVQGDRTILDVQLWDGSSWFSGGAVIMGQPIVCENNYKCFDIAFEQISQPPRAVLAYATGDKYPRYRIWDGTSWSLGNTALDVSQVPYWLYLDEDIYSDEMFLTTVNKLKEVGVQDWDPYNNKFVNYTAATGNSIATSKGFAVSFDRHYP